MTRYTCAGSPLNPSAGLLWWLIPESVSFVVDDAQLDAMRAAGVDSGIVARAVAARSCYADRPAAAAALERAFGAGWQRVMGDSIAARGTSLVRTETGPSSASSPTATWGSTS